VTDAGVTAPSGEAGRRTLAELIRAEIEERGPITFARFMERALYEPELGYYSTRVDRATRGGDFLTAPELHPIFGHALARQLHEMWQRLDEPAEFVLREYGAGTGALGASIAQGLTEMNSPLRARLRYQPVEVAGRGNAIEQRLAALGVSEVLDRRAIVAGPFIGCVLANEFLDALPVNVVVARPGGLREIYVDWSDTGFIEVEGEPSTPDLDAWFAGASTRLPNGHRAEVSLRLADWVGDVSADLARGFAMVIDYGADGDELYGPKRAAGTLRAFAGHRVSSDPYADPGERDLTAHVDFGALERAAVASGLIVAGRTTQAEFLAGCGLEELLADAQARLPDEWAPRLLLRSAVRRLVDPRHLGAYAVSILGRDVEVDPPLRGLSFRLARSRGPQ
jgi:SAM-dependent MidA family methyltransferase